MKFAKKDGLSKQVPFEVPCQNRSHCTWLAIYFVRLSSKLNQYCLLSYRTILLSIISLLNEPNTFSPANVDASVMYRKWRDSKGKDKEYENIIR